MGRICLDTSLENQVDYFKQDHFLIINDDSLSESGKSSALAPHMDALTRTLLQMDINEEYIRL
jgi:hypothetical protein